MGKKLSNRCYKGRTCSSFPDIHIHTIHAFDVQVNFFLQHPYFFLSGTMRFFHSIFIVPLCLFIDSFLPLPLGCRSFILYLAEVLHLILYRSI